MMSTVLAALDQQTMRHGMQPFRDPRASERRRLENRSRWEEIGSARAGTVSGSSRRTTSPWALYAGESSVIMWVWIVTWHHTRQWAHTGLRAN